VAANFLTKSATGIGKCEDAQEARLTTKGVSRSKFPHSREQLAQTAIAERKTDDEVLYLDVTVEVSARLRKKNQKQLTEPRR
jgi:hypothetical protein